LTTKKTKMKKLLPVSGFLILFLLLITDINAQPVAAKKITSAEGITEYQLDNGLKVLLFPDPSKATTTVNITYLVGSRMEGYGETGMAHLLEHMLFKGSTKHTNIPQELTSHGTSPNASTWYDRTNYFETFTASDENLNWALDLESDRMINSFIDNKDLQSEFTVVRNEFEMGENYPSSILMERVMSTAYLWHNYGKSTIGSKEDIEKVPIENLKAFYKKYYQPDNAVLLIAGKFDEEKTLSLINKYFASIPRPARKLQEPYTAEPVQDGERFAILRRTGDVQVMACGYHIPSGSHPDFAAVDVLNDILTDAPSGRLYKALVETKLASNVSGYAFSFKDPAYIYFSSDVLPEKSLDAVATVMMNVLDSLKHHPFTAEETQRAKDNLLKNFNIVYNNSEDVGMLLSEFIAMGDWRLFLNYRDNVEKVKPADVDRVALAYLKPSNRTIGKFIPEKSPERAFIPPPPDLKEMFKDFKGKQALESVATFDATPKNIDAKTKRGTISGGAKYALLSKPTRGNVVKMEMTLRIGSEASLKNKATISNLTASMMMRGTKNKSREQINDALSKLKSTMTIGGGGQGVNISIESSKENLNAVLDLLKEILREPSFPANEFDKLKESEIADIEQQKNEPQSLAFNRLTQLTNNYPKDDFRYPKSYEEMSADVKKTTLAEVTKFYSDFYNSSNATVAAVGDFDENAVTQELTSLLQNWSAPQSYTYAPGLYFDLPSKDEKLNTPDKKNATLAVGLNLQLKDDNADFPALVMGNFILGGGFLNSRLATRIRQKEGLSYGVGSWLQAGSKDEDGTFGSYAIYNPENSDKLMSAYRDELDKMIKTGFIPDELKDAKSGFLQSRERNRAQDDYLASRLNNYLFLDRTMNWDEKIDQAVTAMTVEQINAAMKKWIKPEKIVTVQAGEFEIKKAN
jgi:zinc protease